MTFDGYNLRGVIFTYLEEHGWEMVGEDAWRRPDGVVFRGPSATDDAMHDQIETEEGRQ
jgi:hypothetical protein